MIHTWALIGGWGKGFFFALGYVFEPPSTRGVPDFHRMPTQQQCTNYWPTRTRTHATRLAAAVTTPHRAVFSFPLTGGCVAFRPSTPTFHLDARSVTHRSASLVLHENHRLGAARALVHAILHHVHRRGDELLPLLGPPNHSAGGVFHHEVVPLVQHSPTERFCENISESVSVVLSRINSPITTYVFGSGVILRVEEERPPTTC